MRHVWGGLRWQWSLQLPIACMMPLFCFQIPFVFAFSSAKIVC
ncbi:hypothetical protein COLO4_33949 [Corchorus olitorius]|uniref:Uncharacterized protein n=1 Tax=Corchorus olitorius TaxID=93759 RepID=A0A1R3GQ05_9ROSI|nr:hypothetical protein COLO4_33949 [Corchorus olitorius]